MPERPLARRPERAFIAFAVVFMVTAGCGERQAREYRPIATVERPATEYETRRILLEGPRDLFRGLPDAGPERFSANGHYTRHGSPGIDGRYDVWGNRFCVSQWWEGPIDKCRSMLIGP